MKHFFPRAGRALLLLALSCLAPRAQAQTGAVGVGTTTPHASAALDVVSTSKGLLLPRLTAAQRAAIASPATGLLVYQTDGVQPGFWYYAGSAWLLLPDQARAGDNLGNHAATQPLVLNDNAIRLRTANDANHQLRFDPTVQGPQLFGYQGGELGYNQGAGYQPVLRWNQAGNVGIGTGAPTQMLDVGGNLRVRGLAGADTRLPVVLPDGTLGVNPPVYGTTATTPAFPTAATGSAGTGSNPAAVAVSGTTAYVVNYYGNTLQVFDVANPANPALLGSIGTDNGPNSVAVSGTTAYVVNLNGSTLQAFNVANPAAPTLLGSVGTGSLPYRVAVSGTTAYVATINGVLQTFNVANPAAPALLGSVSTGGQPQDLAVSGTTVYIANSNDSFQLFDVSNPAAPTLLGSIGTGAGSYPIGVAVSGTTAYVANHNSGTLQAFNVANPAAPALLGSTPPTYSLSRVAVNGTTAYVLGATQANTYVLQAYNVAAPGAPALLGTVGLGGSGTGVAVSGTTVYVTNSGTNALQVFTFPGPPRVVAVTANGTLASVPLPSGADFIQNQTGAAQAGGFSLSGDGYLAGSVGIGTTAPGQRLDVRGNAVVSGSVSANSAVVSGSVSAGSVAVSGSVAVNSSVSAGIVSAGSVAVSGSLSANYAVVNSALVNGNVNAASVNTGSAAVTNSLILDQANANPGSFSSQNGLRFGAAGSGEGLASARAAGSPNQYGLDFYTNYANRLAIGNTGNVGIGTPTPGAKLAVNGSLALTPRTCPVNTNADYSLTAADVAYSLFRVQDGNYAPSFTMPALASLVPGQELVVYNRSGTDFTINGTNTDNSAGIVVVSKNTAGPHAVRYVWDGVWVRVP